MSGASPQVIEVTAADVDVSDGATRSDALAVQVNLERRVARHQVTICRIEVTVVSTQNVPHDRPPRQGAGVPQGQVEDSAQMLLELTGHRAVDAPATTRVRPHDEIVDHVCRVARLQVRDLEHLHRHHAGDAEVAGDTQTRLGGHCRKTRVDAGRRGKNPVSYTHLTLPTN